MTNLDSIGLTVNINQTSAVMAKCRNWEKSAALFQVMVEVERRGNRAINSLV